MWKTVPCTESEGKTTPGGSEATPTFASHDKIQIPRPVDSYSYSDLAVNGAEDETDVRWPGDGQDSAVFKALNAFRRGDRLMQIQLAQDDRLRSYLKKDSGHLDPDLVSLECLKICILSGRETLACNVLEAVRSEVPVYLIHRAGEQGMIQFLMRLADSNVPVRTNTVIAAMPYKVKAILRRRYWNKFQRFPAKARFLSHEEVLRWTCLTGGRQGVKKAMEQGLKLDPEALTNVLVSEGLEDLLPNVLHGSSVSLAALLQHGQTHMAIQMVEVT